MNKLRVTMFLALAVCGFAQNNTVVRWHQMAGLITAPAVDNPVGGTTDASGNKINQIHSGGGPWTARGGSAHINLISGEGSFDVEGLVFNGGNATGTPGAVNSIVGTLVCNAGTANQAILDTPAVSLSQTGDAELSFRLNVPAGCTNPIFLIRVPAAGLKWIATAAVRTASDPSTY